MPFRNKDDLTIFFATDLHGSRVCWRKFINVPQSYRADVLVLGGDVTGKAVVPIVRQAGGRYQARFASRERVVGEEELPDLETRISDIGLYPYRTDPDELAELRSRPQGVDRLFLRLMAETLRRWAEWADEKFRGTDRIIYFAPANDDPFELDEVLAELPRFRVVEGEVVVLGDRYEMLTTGYTNRTPWDTPREYDEEEIAGHLGKIAAKVGSYETAIFNIHPPPYDTGIDEGPDLDAETWEQRTSMGTPLTKPVGSRAAREAIETYQPLLSLHGHIHESRGTVHMGRTMAFNPGSDYQDGILRGCLITLGGGKVRGFQLTSG